MTGFSGRKSSSMDFYLKRNQIDSQLWQEYLKKAQKLGFSFSTNPVKLFQDKDNLLHSQTFCWSVRNEILVDPNQVVLEKTPPCTECSGWHSSTFGEHLEHFFYYAKALENETTLMSSFEEVIASLYPYRHISNFSAFKSSELEMYSKNAREACINRARNSIDLLSVDSLLLALAAQSFRAEVSFTEVDVFTRWVESLNLFGRPCFEDDITKILYRKLHESMQSSPADLVAVTIDDPSSYTGSFLSDESLLLAWKNLPQGINTGITLFNTPLLVAQTMSKNNSRLVSYSTEPEYNIDTLKSLRVLLEDSSISLITDLLPSARALNK